MSEKLEKALKYAQTTTFREYLLWKNQNINIGNLIERLMRAHSEIHLFSILKSVLYDSNRFQFKDYSFQFIDLIYSDENLLKQNEILIFYPTDKKCEFDILMCEKRIFELQNVILSFGKTSKITHDETEFAINPCSWIKRNRGINSDYLDICFRHDFDKKISKFIHYVENFSFMSFLYKSVEDKQERKNNIKNELNNNLHESIHENLHEDELKAIHENLHKNNHKNTHKNSHKNVHKHKHHIKKNIKNELKNSLKKNNLRNNIKDDTQ